MTIWVIAPFDYEWPDEWESVWKYDLDNEVISIGWKHLRDVSRLSQPEILTRYQKTYPDAKPGAAISDSHMLHKFYNDVSEQDLVVARRGRKIIAAIGKVIQKPFFDTKLHTSPYPKGNAYPNHLGVRWKKSPRELAFRSQVFGMQTIHEIPAERLRELLNGTDVIGDKSLFPDEAVEDVKIVEGGVKTVTVNAYERDKRARRICIGIHGLNCHVCNMSFEKEYGEIGRDFIHVHHIKKIASRKRPYTLSPMQDLVPVCPNCHAMLHTSDPPLTITQLRAIRLRQAKLRNYE